MSSFVGYTTNGTVTAHKQPPPKCLAIDHAIGSYQVNCLARLIVFFIAESKPEQQTSPDGNYTTESCKICIVIMSYAV